MLALALLVLGRLHSQWDPEAIDLPELRLVVIACWLLGIGVSFIPPLRLPAILGRLYFLPGLLGTNLLYLYLIWLNQGQLDYRG